MKTIKVRFQGKICVKPYLINLDVEQAIALCGLLQELISAAREEPPEGEIETPHVSSHFDGSTYAPFDSSVLSSHEFLSRADDAGRTQIGC